MNDNEAFREDKASVVGHRTSKEVPGNLLLDIDGEIKSRNTWIALFRVWAIVSAVCLFGSCLAAPFLVPIFQLVLIPPVLVAMALGVLGGVCRAWWLTMILWGSIVATYVWYDVTTNTYGYASMYSTYILKNPPMGFMYYHTWAHLYQITILPLTLSAAVLAHGWVLRRWATHDSSVDH